MEALTAHCHTFMEGLQTRIGNLKLFMKHDLYKIDKPDREDADGEHLSMHSVGHGRIKILVVAITTPFTLARSNGPDCASSVLPGATCQCKCDWDKLGATGVG